MCRRSPANTNTASQCGHETRALSPCFVAEPSRKIRVRVELFGCSAERRIQLARIYVLLQLPLPRRAPLEEHNFCARNGINEGGNAGPESGKEHGGIGDHHVAQALGVMILQYAQGGFGDRH